MPGNKRFCDLDEYEDDSLGEFQISLRDVPIGKAVKKSVPVEMIQTRRDYSKVSETATIKMELFLSESNVGECLSTRF